MNTQAQHIAKQEAGRLNAPVASSRVRGVERGLGRVKLALKPMAAIVPLTVFSACQMEQANEAMRGMSLDRMTVARAAFSDMGTDELAGMLLLSEELVEECDDLRAHTRVRSFLSARVERQPFRDPQLDQSRLETARAAFSERHGIMDPTERETVCAAAKSEINEQTFLGVTLVEGSVH